MERKTLLGIIDVALDCGLYFNSSHTTLSPSYGIDNPVMEFRGLCVPVEKVAGNLKDKENVTKEDVIQAFKIAVRPAVVLRENQAHFENACDCLYYGYGFKDWNHDGLSDEDAKIIWKAAFHKMANS